MLEPDLHLPQLGIIGAGAIAGVYFDAASESGAFEIGALADCDPGVLAARGREAPRITLYDNAESVLCDPRIDAVVLALPHHLHAPMAIEALNADKDVICEKPIALSLSDAEAVRAVEARSGRRLIIRCYLRALQHHRWLHDAIAAGLFGQVSLMRGLFASDRRAALADPDDWHGDWDRAGGGVLIDSGYHLVDFARHLLGEVEDVSTQIRHTCGDGNGGEDVCALTLRHAGGAVTSVACVWCDDLRPFRWEREIYGSIGVAFVTDAEGCSHLEARLRGGEPQRRTILDWWARANRDAVIDCVTALSSGSKASGGAVSSKEAMDTLRVVLAAYRSTEGEQAVQPASLRDDFRPAPLPDLQSPLPTEAPGAIATREK